MKVSKYIIISKVTETESMLIHGYTGTIDLVSNQLADLLQSHLSTDISEETVEACEPGTYNELLQRGYLTQRTDREEEAYVARLASALHRKDKLIGSEFTVVVTYDCNFRCPYCFELNSKSQNIRLKTIDKNGVDRMFETIEAIQQTQIVKHNDIVLFGGEPLLKDNVEIIEYIVAEAKKRAFSINAITNGYDLEHYLHLLGADGIEHIQITIDGLTETHDNKRQHKDGIPTFDKIVRNIKMALLTGVTISVRFNADKTNITEYNHLLDYFKKSDLTDTRRLHIYPSLLINHDNDTTGHSSFFFSDKDFIRLYSENNADFKINDYQTYYKLVSSIKNNKPLPYHATFCGSQVGGVVFDPFFNLYPCWEKVGDRKHIIGTYRNGYPEWHDEAYTAWNNHNVMSSPECQKCPCALLCGGGCIAHNYNGHRCTHMRDLIDIAAKRAYRELHSNKSDKC